MAYSSSEEFLVESIIPVVHRSWSSLVVFIRGNLLPSITGLYSENVEPQLVKIGERLASYREGRKLRTVIDQFESASEPSNSGSLASTLKYANDLHTTTTISPTIRSTESNVPLPEEPQVQNVEEQISSDLSKWQQKFAAAADRGVHDLRDRVEHIVNSQLESGVNRYGKALLEALTTVQDHEISNVKTHISDLIKSLPIYQAPEEEDKANEDLLRSIRTAGIPIRDRAHALREWYISFEQELVRRVTAASDSTIDVLNGVRDLGLQEIGMRWAWMEGVSYKDWAKYHDLRKQLDDWRDEVQQAGLQHEKVEEAKTIASDILSQGMAIAEDAAKELSRLKEVGRWKILARESSENFEDRSEPPLPLPIPEDEHNSNGSSVSDEEHADANSSDSLSSGELHVPRPSVIDDIDPAEDATTTVHIELTENTPSADERKAAGVPQDSTHLPNAVTEESDDELVSEMGSSNMHSPSNKVWGGVAAQVVANQVPIMDETDEDEHGNFAEEIERLAGEASERFAEATKAVSEALYGQTHTPNLGEQAASIARDQYSRALAAASSALYVSSATSGGHFTDAASEKYRNAVAAASSAFQNLPPHATQTSTGPLETISSIALSRLQEGLSIASAQFASLKASIAPTSTATPNPFMLDAQRRYYEAIGLAHDHYTAFISSASQAVYPSPTPTPTPSIGNVQGVLEHAISQYHQISSLASSSLAAVVASASSLAESGEDSARGVIDDALSKYSIAMSGASASLSLASESASAAIYGTPTGNLEAISSKASESWEDLVSRASEQIYGTPTPFVQQLYDEQISRFEAVESYVSELVLGREPDFTESVMSKLRSAYETPYPEAALSSASSYASQAYSSAASFVASQATTPPMLDDILEAANEQLNSAVDAVSGYVYGTSKGNYEQATSAAADAYSTVSSQMSEAVYGTQVGYVEAARSQVDAAFSSAQIAISTAIYGTPAGPAEAALSGASEAYASATSAVAGNVAAAESMMNSAYSNLHSQASSALLPKQQGALESATSRLAHAVESAQARLSDYASKLGDQASKLQSDAAKVVEGYGSSVSSVVSKAKDEL